MRLSFSLIRAEAKVGAVNEAYALGEAAGVLLDWLEDGDRMKGKRELLSRPAVTPMDLLGERVAGTDDIPSADTTISDDLVDRTREALKTAGEPRYRAILKMIHDSVF